MAGEANLWCVCLNYFAGEKPQPIERAFREWRTGPSQPRNFAGGSVGGIQRRRLPVPVYVALSGGVSNPNRPRPKQRWPGVPALLDPGQLRGTAPRDAPQQRWRRPWGLPAVRAGPGAASGQCAVAGGRPWRRHWCRFAHRPQSGCARDAKSPNGDRNFWLAESSGGAPAQQQRQQAGL